MLNLSKINAKATIKTNANNTKQSAQLDVFNALQTAKTKRLSGDKVLDIISTYTLRPDKQRDTWFKTEANYNTFVNEAESIKTENEANEFVLKHKPFIDAMNKKTFDLVFNAKHKRSFHNNVAYNDKVKVHTEFLGKNVNFAKSYIEVK